MDVDLTSDTPVTFIDDDDNFVRPLYLTWKQLVGMHLSTYASNSTNRRTELLLRKNEGVTWVRGRVSVRSREWAAMLVARGL
jgi:hypothetical protein